MNSQRINVGNMDNTISLHDQDPQPSIDILRYFRLGTNGAITGDLNQVDELNSSGAFFLLLCLDVILDNGQRHSTNYLVSFISVAQSSR